MRNFRRRPCGDDRRSRRIRRCGYSISPRVVIPFQFSSDSHLGFPVLCRSWFTMANREFAIDIRISLRDDFDAGTLRGLTKQSGDANQTPRLLALASIYDGASVLRWPGSAGSRFKLSGTGCCASTLKARRGDGRAREPGRWRRKISGPNRPGSSAPSVRKGVWGVGLVVARCNTAMMPLHLDEIAAQVAPGAHALLMMDPAGWHMIGKLQVPDNITILPLPPKAPELNPVENIWPPIFSRR
ncbi:hypothetical protein CN094_38385 [Sinorhizobium meliloti]|nr:hypothetical protein CN094_38385 [Sinorhizobium meliloti]